MVNINKLRTQFHAYEKLQTISKKLHRLDEGDCNGRSEQGQKTSETREKNLMNEAQELAKSINKGLIAYHQGDPRGCALYLITEEQKKTNQYHEGVVI